MLGIQGEAYPSLFGIIARSPNIPLLLLRQKSQCRLIPAHPSISLILPSPPVDNHLFWTFAK